MRIGKAGEPTYINKNSDKWVFGKIRKITTGKNICIFDLWANNKKTFELKEKLKNQGLSVEINSCHTLKPFDFINLKKKFKKFRKIITIEDHSEVGGLASIVKEAAYNNSYKGKIFSYSLKDKFIHCYGDQNDLLIKHGMSVNKFYKYVI